MGKFQEAGFDIRFAKKFLVLGEGEPIRIPVPDRGFQFLAYQVGKYQPIVLPEFVSPDVGL
jgi:hypothetical protein